MANKCYIPRKYQILKPEEIEDYLEEVAGIDLNSQLDFSRHSTLRTFALAGPLIVLYRYAEQLPFRITVKDMFAGGHQSHCIGSELDFDHSTDKLKVDKQVNMIHDLLLIRQKLRSELVAFRLGFYFDRFDHVKDKSGKVRLETKDYAAFIKTYKKGHIKYSLHLGVMYRWKYPSAVSKYATIGQPKAKFSFWGRGTKSFNKQTFWEQRFMKGFAQGEGPKGFLSENQINRVSEQVLNDFQWLDFYSSLSPETAQSLLSLGRNYVPLLFRIPLFYH